MGMAYLSWGTPKLTTIVNNGDPNNRLDIAIIGDGYTSSEQRMFRDDAQTIVDAFRNTEPTATYFNHLNFHRIDVISAESGTDDMYADPPQQRRTALDTFFSPLSERRLVGPDPWVMAVATMSGAPWDAIMVVVNSPRRGGAVLPTMGVAYASRNSSDFPEIMIHEAGHSIAKLMDEYTGDLPDIDFAEGWSLPNLLPWANIDTDAQKPKWKVWLSPGVQRPTPDTRANADLVGAFEGAAYTGFGVYRPESRCIMNGPGRDGVNRNNNKFCRICAEQWIKAIYKRSKIADAFTPEQTRPFPPLLVDPRESITFGADVVRSQKIRTTWRTKRLEDFRWRRRQRTDDYSDFSVILPDTNVLPLVGTYWMVECTLEDTSARIRTRSVKRLAKETFTWHIISFS